MITFVYPTHPRQGYRLDLSCPAVLCDTCGRLIDADRPGNVLWTADDRHVWHAHKGRCDDAVESAAGEHLMSSDVGDWLTQLGNNYRSPLIGSQVTLESGTEYSVGAVRTMAEDEAVES